MQEQQNESEVLCLWSFSMAPQFLGPLTFQRIVASTSRTQQPGRSGPPRSFARKAQSAVRVCVLGLRSFTVKVLRNRLLISCRDSTFFRQSRRSARPRASSVLILTGAGGGGGLKSRSCVFLVQGGGGAQVLPRALRALFPLLPSDCPSPVFRPCAADLHTPCRRPSLSDLGRSLSPHHRSSVLLTLQLPSPRLWAPVP